MRFRLIEEFLLEGKNTEVFYDDTTGLAGYDQYLHNKSEQEYLRDEKDIGVEVMYLTPKEYILGCANLMRLGYEYLINDRKQGNKVDELKKLIQSGKKLNMPMIDFALHHTQEGLHRMVAVGELYGYTSDTYPVLVIYKLSNWVESNFEYIGEIEELPEELMDISDYESIGNYTYKHKTADGMYACKMTSDKKLMYFFDTNAEKWYSRDGNEMTEETERGGLYTLQDKWIVTMVQESIREIPTISESFRCKIRRYCEFPELVFSILQIENLSKNISSQADNSTHSDWIINLDNLCDCMNAAWNSGSKYVEDKQRMIYNEIGLHNKIKSDSYGGNTMWLDYKCLDGEELKYVTELDCTLGEVIIEITDEMVSFLPNLKTFKIGKDCKLKNADCWNLRAWGNSCGLYINKNCENYNLFINRVKDELFDKLFDTANMSVDELDKLINSWDNKKLFEELHKLNYIKIEEQG